MCCDFEFFASFLGSESMTGDIAKITKVKPEGMAGALTELFSNADNHKIQFNLNANLSAAQKTTVLAGQLLLDYMLFDGETNEKCDCDNNSIYCYFCYCSVIGSLWPCYVRIPFNNEKG